MQERIVILTGAGISAESGINTFRDAGGLWENHRIEDVATPEAFQRDPHGVQSFYNRRREQLRDPAIQPNAAHRALAELEQALPGQVLVVTQNVDDLHERAGRAAQGALPEHRDTGARRPRSGPGPELHRVRRRRLPAPPCGVVR